MRVRKQGLKGLEASTIGLTLVGYIAAGFFIGQWLDGHFKTAFWMPLLVLVGTGAGFRDILKLVTRMGRQDEIESNDRAVARQTVASRAAESTAVETARTEEVENRPKPRIFAVPPPPRASFERTPEDAENEGDKGGRSTPALFTAEGIAEADDKMLIEQLLAEEELDERPDDEEKDSETQ